MNTIKLIPLYEGFCNWCCQTFWDIGGKSSLTFCPKCHHIDIELHRIFMEKVIE